MKCLHFELPGPRFDANSNRMPDRTENFSSSEEWKANKMNKHWNKYVAFANRGSGSVRIHVEENG